MELQYAKVKVNVYEERLRTSNYSE